VLVLQQLLAALGLASPLSSVYCALTLASMQQFQRQHGLPPSGLVDARGLRSLEAAAGAAASPMAPRQLPVAPTAEAPAGSFKAGVYALSSRRRAAEDQSPAVAPAIVAEPAAAAPSADADGAAYRVKKARTADLNLKLATRELEATTQELQSRGLVARIFFPEETRHRRDVLANQLLPELRAREAEYRTAQRLGAPEAELDAKLDRYFSASIEAREFVKSSLDTERGQFAQTDKALERTIDTTRVVRDVSLGTAAALSTGGGALLAGGVVLGGAAVKTASNEAERRVVTGEASTAGELVTGLAKNGAGLAVDAAGGATFRALGAAAQAGRVGLTGFAAGAGATSVVGGATKRAIDGGDALDGRALLTDALTGAVTGGASQRWAPAVSHLGQGARAAAEGTLGAASGAGAQALSNAVHGRELTEGLGEAALVGAGTGVVVGAPSRRAAVEPPVLPRAAVEPPVLPRAAVEPPVLPRAAVEPPVLPRAPRPAAPVEAAPQPRVLVQVPERSVGTLDTARLTPRTREALAALAARGEQKVTVYALGQARSGEEATRLAQRTLDTGWRRLHDVGQGGADQLIALGADADARVAAAFRQNKGQRNDVVKAEIDLTTGQARISQVDFDPQPTAPRVSEPVAPRVSEPVAPRVSEPVAARPTLVDAPVVRGPSARLELDARGVYGALGDRTHGKWGMAERTLADLRREGVTSITLYSPNVGGVRAPQDLVQVSVSRLADLARVAPDGRPSSLAFAGAGADAQMAAALRTAKASPNGVVKAVIDLSGPVARMETSLVDFAPGA
jgi:hypothetical protein